MKILIALLFSFSAWANPFFGEEPLIGARNKEIKLGSGPVLVVNIATQCGYTPQLDELEALSKKYKEQGLTIVGVPSNDFGGQTPEADEAVADFCKINYGVTFPLTKKAVVSGDKKIPLMKKLTTSADEKGEIKWNFEKFLVSSDGKEVKRFRSGVKPESKELASAIESMLKK